MSRPWVLVFLLLLIVCTSQVEWKERLVNDVEGNPAISIKQQHASQREEIVKEKIILSQEKKIQKLDELVGSLREQLLQCKSEYEAINSTTAPLSTLLNELERQRNLED